MSFLSAEQVLELHSAIIVQSGGGPGMRDLAAFESCMQQPFQGFGDTDFYPSVIDKAIAFGYFLVRNHPFVDGNKRIGHAVMAVNLEFHQWEIQASIDEQEQLILDLAAGKLDKETFFEWVKVHLHPFGI